MVTFAVSWEQCVVNILNVMLLGCQVTVEVRGKKGWNYVLWWGGGGGDFYLMLKNK